MALWPPSVAPMAHGLPASPSPTAGRLLGATPLAAPDRMNRRQIQHVEAHLRDVGQQSLAIGEVAATLGCARGRAGKHLVPTRKARALPRSTSSESGGSEHARDSAGGCADMQGRILRALQALIERRRLVRQRFCPGIEHGCVVPILIVPGARAAARASCAPRIRSIPRSRSCPAARFFSRSMRQVSSASTQPSTRYSHRPSRPTWNEPCQRSLPRARIGTRCQSGSDS